MKILYVRPYPGEIDHVRTALPDADVHEVSEIEDLAENTLAEIEVLSVFVDFVVGEEVLSKLPKVRLIATRSSGVDHIDLEAAKARDIEVVRVPHYGTNTVAEYAFSLMFALSRKAFSSYIDLQKNSVIKDLSVYEGFDLCGKTLGVIGTGAIGRNVCRIGVGLGMEVLAYDVAPDEELAETVGFSYASLAALLNMSDIVTLHVPSIPATHHLMGEEEFAQMKPGAFLINTARGEIVDTKALLNSLQNGRLAGAALDVLEGEHELKEEASLLAAGEVDSELWQKLVADHILIDHPRVIVTPHIAFNTKEAKQEITDTTVANIVAWQGGKIENNVI